MKTIEEMRAELKARMDRIDADFPPDVVARGKAAYQFYERLEILRGKLASESAWEPLGVLSAADLTLAGRAVAREALEPLLARLEALREAFDQEGRYTRVMVVDDTVERLQAWAMAKRDQK
jgi:hypothetical protein